MNVGHAVDSLKKNDINWACETLRDRRVAYRVLVAKSDGRRPFGRPRFRWKDYIKMDHGHGLD
jgi:hypothetical protein